jgi:BolA protein
MTREETITLRLTRALSPEHLVVENESHAHAVPKGSETHFRVVVVSRAFEGKSPVRRHQLVYAALEDELTAGLHALAITSRTPDEWAARPEANVSPLCHGGSTQVRGD